MASTYSALKIELIGTGEQSGTWGTTTNVNLGTAIEEAITGSTDITFASAPVTLTLTNTNAAQPARNLRLNLGGTSGGPQDLIVPAIEKQYIVYNGCADAITIKNSTGTGIKVLPGKTTVVFNNGTNVVDAITQLTSLNTTVLSIPDATSVTINADATNIAEQLNTQAVGTLTMNAPTGTLVNGQKLIFRIKSTNVQTFSWNAVFSGSTDLGLPTASSGGNLYDYMGFIYNSTAAKWQIIGKVFGF